MKPRQMRKGRLLDFHRDDMRVKYWLLNGSEERSAEDEAAIAAAQHEEKAERLRCFYVGVTRARHACWVSSGGGEVFDYLLHGDVNGIELAAEHAAIDVQSPPTDGERVPPVRTETLHDARSFHGRIARDWRRHSFSALTRGEHDFGTGKRDEPDDADAGEADAREVIEVPSGTRYGTAVHAILEKTDFAAWRDRADAPPEAQALLERELRAQGFAVARGQGDTFDGTARLLAATLNTHIVSGMRLVDLPDAARRAELEFHFGIHDADVRRMIDLLHEAGYQRDRDGFAGIDARLRGLMNGIIDLVFVHDGRWYIVDYKTNRLGRRYRDYAPERLRDAVAESDYDLQYLIYTVALHRWLRRMPGLHWDYERDFGGVRYLFLRGLRPEAGAEYGVHTDRPPAALIEALDGCLAAGDGQ
jgi:exodeoxyribonuclease V beta subunit